MNKVIVFDMDGTLADFYNVKGWLNDLQHENTRPYDIAKPLYDMETLNALLDVLKLQGWQIIVTSWLAKNASIEFENAIKESKKAWLKKYNFQYDEINLIKYGTLKSNSSRRLGGFQVLIDDDEQVRKNWHLGATIDANKNILNELVKLLEQSV
jgi:phosphoglycolate phosphatase-like HAD superfamily hydrolase